MKIIKRLPFTQQVYGADFRARCVSFDLFTFRRISVLFKLPAVVFFFESEDGSRVTMYEISKARKTGGRSIVQ